jgi:hypothetical protein
MIGPRQEGTAMSELPDYEVEIEVIGARFPVLGYVQVRGTSTREAVEEAVQLIEQRVGVSWWGPQDNRVRWDDFFQAGMEVQIADVAPYGTRWKLRRYAAATAANQPTDE